MSGQYVRRLLTSRDTLVGRLVAYSFMACVTAGCSVTVSTGAFTQLGAIDTQLKKGVSSRMDVQRILGAPKGSGGAVLPPDVRAYDVWYYEDVEATGSKADPISNAINLEFRQQILLVFFKEDKFEGYLWTSSKGAGYAD